MRVDRAGASAEHGYPAPEGHNDFCDRSMNGELRHKPQRLLLLGFGDFERHALASYLRLAAGRDPAFEQVESIAEADFLIADADHHGAIDAVLAADRAGDTVFIGSLAPEHALAWAMRPINPLQVFRAIEAAVALRGTPSSSSSSSGPPTTSPGLLDAPTRRSGDQAASPLVLVVDDSEVAQRFMVRQLDGLGLHAEAASHSARALHLMSLQRYDIVFVDVDLGPASELDGLSLCQRIKQAKRPPGTGLAPKVVMVSAHASATDRVRGTLAGCDGYLAKPLDDKTLVGQLRRVGLLAEPPRARSSRRSREAPAKSESTPLR